MLGTSVLQYNPTRCFTVNQRMTFGQQLRALRLARGWSQRALSFKFGQLRGKEEGIATSVIAAWERDKRPASRPTVLLMAQALRASDEERDALLTSAGFLPIESTQECKDSEFPPDVKAALRGLKLESSRHTVMESMLRTIEKLKRLEEKESPGEES